MGLFPATEKLFDGDAYAVEFKAKVLSAELIEKKKSRYWEIVLDRTLFFPEEGGQTPDTGVLNGFPVVDVQLDGDVILHSVKAEKTQKSSNASNTAGAEQTGKDGNAGNPGKAGGAGEGQAPFVPGQIVRGQIDFAHRFSNMQNHSGEHILSGLVHNRFGYDNVGFHLSDNTVTLDFNGPLKDEDILWLEQTANRVVWDNKEIRGWYPDLEELRSIEYRSKKEIDGPLRLVEIPDVDMCACCAPHVRRTGEIGLIKVIRTLRERSGIRLTILCGSRALAYMQTLQKAAEDVSHLTNMPREEIAAGTSRILDENERLKQREAALEAAVTDALASSVPAEQENVFIFTEGNTGSNASGSASEGGAAGNAGIGNLAQRRLVNTLCEAHPGYCGVFAGNDENGYRYIIGATGNGDARALNACLRKYCSARGGGKPAMVQGSVMATEEGIRAALKKALCEISES